MHGSSMTRMKFLFAATVVATVLVLAALFDSLENLGNRLSFSPPGVILAPPLELIRPGEPENAIRQANGAANPKIEVAKHVVQRALPDDLPDGEYEDKNVLFLTGHEVLFDTPGTLNLLATKKVDEHPDLYNRCYQIQGICNIRDGRAGKEPGERGETLRWGVYVHENETKLVLHGVMHWQTADETNICCSNPDPENGCKNKDEDPEETEPPDDPDDIEEWKISPDDPEECNIADSSHRKRVAVAPRPHRELREEPHIASEDDENKVIFQLRTFHIPDEGHECIHPKDKLHFLTPNVDKSMRFWPNTTWYAIRKKGFTVTLGKGFHELTLELQDNLTIPVVLQYMRLISDKRIDVVRLRWRPNAVSTIFQKQNANGQDVLHDVDAFVMSIKSECQPAKVFAPMKFYKGYYGLVMDPTDDPKVGRPGGATFSVWTRGQKETPPPLAQFSRLLGIGHPTAKFGFFGHEGKGVKVRDYAGMWDGYDHSAKEYVIGLKYGEFERVDATGGFRTYSTFYYNGGWQFYATAKRWFPKDKGEKSMKMSTFIESTGHVKKMRTGHIPRSMSYRAYGHGIEKGSNTTAWHLLNGVVVKNGYQYCFNEDDDDDSCKGGSYDRSTDPTKLTDRVLELNADETRFVRGLGGFQKKPDDQGIIQLPAGQPLPEYMTQIHQMTTPDFPWIENMKVTSSGNNYFLKLTTMLPEDYPPGQHTIVVYFGATDTHTFQKHDDYDDDDDPWHPVWTYEKEFEVDPDSAHNCTWAIQLTEDELDLRENIYARFLWRNSKAQLWANKTAHWSGNPEEEGPASETCFVQML